MNETDVDDPNPSGINQCQERKSIYARCRRNVECLRSEGLKCYRKRKQCDCDDLNNK